MPDEAMRSGPEKVTATKSGQFGQRTCPHIPWLHQIWWLSPFSLSPFSLLTFLPSLFNTMAITIMFGLGFATILALFVVPVLYVIFFGIHRQ